MQVIEWKEKHFIHRPIPFLIGISEKFFLDNFCNADIVE